MADANALRLRWAPLAAAVVVGCVVGAGLTSLWMGPTNTGLAAPAAPAIAPESQRLIIDAIKKVGPAVVNIDTEMRTEMPELPPAFRQFFGEPFPRKGQASGVIIDPRGYVLTNNHVLQDASQVTVTLADGRTFNAKIVGTDPLSDIGVARIPGDNLPVAKLGTSDDKPIGSWVIAIGNPFGFENSVTVGVLSARNRSLRAPSGQVLDHLLQTDAAINPGNSGGALVDIAGEVIAIPTAIIQYAQGIGFAISAESARKASSELIATGHVSHPYIGVALGPVSEDAQRQLRLPNRNGGVVGRVEAGSPADKAGIKVNDVIVRIGTRDATNPDVVVNAVRGAKVGDQLALTVRREGKEVTVSVTVGERPAVPQQ